MIKFEELKKDASNGGDLSLFGAFRADQIVEFRLVTGERFDSAELVIHADGLNREKTEWLTYPMQGGNGTFALTLALNRLLGDSGLTDEGLFYYHYDVTAEDGTHVILGGERPTELEELEDYVGERQLLVYRSDYRTSEAFAEGMAYQIFVDRFCRSGRSPVKAGAVLDPDWENGVPEYGAYPGAPVDNRTFFGGDLPGITEKLDYLASLGVKTLYLTPIFDAASNHKYDTGDYLAVDEMFGGDEAFAELCRSAKERGMIVMLDGVFNHTGADSVYFNQKGTYRTLGAAQSMKSAYSDWYNFRSFPDDYECWWGVKVLPRVRSELPSYRRFICGAVVKKWMDAGASGWRLDVADELSEEFLDDFRAAVRRENPDAVVLGEVWEDASDKISYGKRRHYLGGRELDSVMNYPLRDALIGYVKNGETEPLRRATEGTYRRYPKQTSDNLLNFLGTHDTERIITKMSETDTERMTNDELAVLHMTEEEWEAASARVRLAFGILFGLPGVPCVYYGDEVGLEGGRDPFCRRPFPWHMMDEKMLRAVQTLGQIRREETVFRHGLFRLVHLTDRSVAYLREPENGAGGSILVAAVRAGECRLDFSADVTDLADGTAAHSVILPTGGYGYYRIQAGTAFTLTE